MSSYDYYGFHLVTINQQRNKLDFTKLQLLSKLKCERLPVKKKKEMWKASLKSMMGKDL